MRSKMNNKKAHGRPKHAAAAIEAAQTERRPTSERAERLEARMAEQVGEQARQDAEAHAAVEAARSPDQEDRSD